MSPRLRPKNAAGQGCKPCLLKAILLTTLPSSTNPVISKEWIRFISHDLPAVHLDRLVPITAFSTCSEVCSKSWKTTAAPSKWKLLQHQGSRSGQCWAPGRRELPRGAAGEPHTVLGSVQLCTTPLSVLDRYSSHKLLWGQSIRVAFWLFTHSYYDLFPTWLLPFQNSIFHFWRVSGDHQGLSGGTASFLFVQHPSESWCRMGMRISHSKARKLLESSKKSISHGPLKRLGKMTQWRRKQSSSPGWAELNTIKGRKKVLIAPGVSKQAIDFESGS